MTPHRTISFIGLGLIGMSLLQAMKHSPFARECPISCIGFDPNLDEADRCCVQQLGLDCFTDDKQQLYGADLVILCAPVEINISLLDEIRRYAAPGTIVSDVSSTKHRIAGRAAALGLPFIGMHPMAGKEHNGFRESHAELLQGRPLILCDDQGLLHAGHGQFLVSLIESAGCRPLYMSAADHDRVVANVSHLPQMLATSLIIHCHEHLSQSGPGLATMVRLAGSSWAIWRDIVATNSENIAGELESYAAELTILAGEIRAERLDTLEARFTEANTQYRTINNQYRP